MADRTRVLRFGVAETDYCINIDAVEQVIDLGELSDAPHLNEYAEGVMAYRDKTIEVWNSFALFEGESTAEADRKKKRNRQLQGTFEEIEQYIQQLVQNGDLTDTEAAEELTEMIAGLREDVLDADSDVSNLTDMYDVIVLSEDYQPDDRRISLLVDRVDNVSIVDRQSLDKSVGGNGVYGVIQNIDEDDDDDDDDDNVTIWINPDTLLG